MEEVWRRPKASPLAPVLARISPSLGREFRDVSRRTNQLSGSSLSRHLVSRCAPKALQPKPYYQAAGWIQVRRACKNSSCAGYGRMICPELSVLPSNAASSSLTSRASRIQGCWQAPIAAATGLLTTIQSIHNKSSLFLPKRGRFPNIVSMPPHDSNSSPARVSYAPWNCKLDSTSQNNKSSSGDARPTVPKTKKKRVHNSRPRAQKNNASREPFSSSYLTAVGT